MTLGHKIREYKIYFSSPWSNLDIYNCVQIKNKSKDNLPLRASIQELRIKMITKRNLWPLNPIHQKPRQIKDTRPKWVKGTGIQYKLTEQLHACIYSVPLKHKLFQFRYSFIHYTHKRSSMLKQNVVPVQFTQYGPIIA